MNKADPTAIADAFAGAIQSGADYFARVSNAIAGLPNEKSDTATLAEHTLLSFAVDLESFCSDWALACINRDFSVMLAYDEQRVQASVKDKLGTWYAQHASLKAPAHISMSDLRGVLDRDGWNISFKTFDHFRRWTTDRLGAAYATKVSSRTADDELLFNAVKCMRNYAGHGSGKSHQELNTALHAVGASGPISALGTQTYKVDSLGKFLRTTVGGHRRIELYAQWLRTFANALR